MLKDIPNIIGNAKTLFIAETHGQFDLVERNGKKVEIVFIAVCQYDPEEGFYLFGCDKDFNTLTDYYYDELDEALDDAKRIYNLKLINWRQPLSTNEIVNAEEIYIPVIDGVRAWFPAKAKSLGNNQFLILNNKEFDCTDYSSLPEFIPGDTVSIEQKILQNNANKPVAKSLITASSHPDKKFFEFLYHATISDISVDATTLNKYRPEIERVKQESKDGQYFYPAILETIEKFNKIKKAI